MSLGLLNSKPRIGPRRRGTKSPYSRAARVMNASGSALYSGMLPKNRVPGGPVGVGRYVAMHAIVAGPPARCASDTRGLLGMDGVAPTSAAHTWPERGTHLTRQLHIG